MKYRVGFDIGIKSVGWSVVENDINTEEPIRIVDLGVRTFDANEVPKSGESTAKERRELRGVRRRRRRKEYRKLRMEKLLNKTLGIDYENDVVDILKDDVYALRARGLDERLNNVEIARVVMNILKRRGFKSNRKEIKPSKEEGNLLKALNENEEFLKDYRTIGEAIVKAERFKSESESGQGYSIRNHGDYKNCFYRSDLEAELKSILSAQQKFGNTAITDEFVKKVIDIFTSQRNFDEGPGKNSIYRTDGFSVRNCTFITTEKRAPKTSCTFEMFNALSRLNSLKINGEPLDEKDYKMLQEKVTNYLDIKFSQIRKWLKIDYNKTFNMCNYFINDKDREGISDTQVTDKIENKVFISFPRTSEIRKKTGLLPNGNEELFDEIALMLSMCKSDSTIDKYVSENKVLSQLDASQILAIKSINFDKFGFGNLSIKAMKQIMPYLLEGKTYDKACESAGYNHNGRNFEKRKFLEGEKVNERLNDILSPTVKRSVNQTIRILNEIIKKYGSPQFVTIELARDFERLPSERKKIEDMQKERYQENQKHVEEIKKYKANPSGEDILKYRLYEEQLCKCMYSGEVIDINHLFSDNYYQIDHALPQSRSLDDSYLNKVLVKTSENQKKGNLTPYEYFKKYKTEADWEAYVARVHGLRNFKKQKQLLIENYSEGRQKDFIERNINDTRYISRAMFNLLQDFLITEPNKKYKKVIKSVNGGVTAYLRKCWGINKLREDGDAHHSIDATVIAVATDAMVEKITKFNQIKEKYFVKDNFVVDPETGEKLEISPDGMGKRLPKPYENFVKELALRSLVKYDGQNYNENEIKELINLGYVDEDLKGLKPLFVSRMKAVKTTGAIHKDTMYSTKAYDKTDCMLIKTVPLEKLTLVEKPESQPIKGDKHPNLSIANYCQPLKDTRLYLLLKENLVADPNYFKTHPEIVRPNKDGKTGMVVKKVKVYEKASNPVFVGTGAFDADRIHRIDIFKKNDKYFAIPVYIKDVYLHKLPNKIVTSGKPLDLDDSYDFQFSLYQNDLIKIEWKNGSRLSKIKDNDNSSKPENIELTNGLFYYNSFDRATCSIKIFTCDRCYASRGVGIQNLKNISKCYVDIMGNVYNAPKEMRKELWWGI